MYPSSVNNGFDPPRTTISGSYYNESNHSNEYPQEHYHTPSSSSSYLHPSPHIPLEDEAVFCEFFQRQQFFWNGHNYDNNHNVILPQEMVTTTNGDSPMGECSYNNGQVVTMNDGDEFNTRVMEHQISSSGPMKTASKRDRHSKINTARGPRDRRMRLSLDVAKKLFGLQDLLGFDKASMTVDWLLNKSKTAILDLLPDHSCSFMDVSNNSASSTSECEVVSGTGDQSVVKSAGVDDQDISKNKVKDSSESIKKPKERISRVVKRCADFHHPVAKASREKARERARERTILKKYNKPVDQFGSWSVGEFDQISSSFRFQQGFVADNASLLMTGNWSPSYSFNIQQSPGQTHEMIGKAWEGNSN
uniref:transcription factor CYCLOIDEA-like n=1 Tax=Erigeron canadensis TaxID=72917 RepID=UPI001CB94D2D|nr:transcription factor CYCLOIDEA-like [Erigeron canadensis]